MVRLHLCVLILSMCPTTISIKLATNGSGMDVEWTLTEAEWTRWVIHMDVFDISLEECLTFRWRGVPEMELMVPKTMATHAHSLNFISFEKHPLIAVCYSMLSSISFIRQGGGHPRAEQQRQFGRGRGAFIFATRSPTTTTYN